MYENCFAGIVQAMHKFISMLEGKYSRICHSFFFLLAVAMCSSHRYNNGVRTSVFFFFFDLEISVRNQRSQSRCENEFVER